MDRLSNIGKFFRLVYTQVFLRFSSQIREPYLIRVDKIYSDPLSNELCVSFHIANKRVNQVLSVEQFVANGMLYMVDPRIVFDLGQQFGTHSEKLIRVRKPEKTLKDKCILGLKRVFIDE